MRILNIHERRIDGPPAVVSELLDGLSGPNDRLWPGAQWPPMQFDAPLGAGAAGGHGVVRYHVSEYVPGRKVVFTFDHSGILAALNGIHWFEVVPNGEQTVLRHVIEASGDFRTWLHWAVVVRPLHDALLEDALDLAERAANPSRRVSSRWSLWVRFLRFLLKRKG